MDDYWRTRWSLAPLPNADTQVLLLIARPTALLTMAPYVGEIRTLVVSLACHLAVHSCMCAIWISISINSTKPFCRLEASLQDATA